MRGLANINKLQHTKVALKEWNQKVFGNIFTKLNDAEQLGSQAHVEYENFPNEINRESTQLANAKLIKAVNDEKEYWKQKANIRWLDKGDANSNLFQAFPKRKRKKLSITHILSTEGKGLSSPGEIKEAALTHFQKLYKADHNPIIEPIIPLIPKVITLEDNSLLTALPTLEEVKRSVWELDGNSASGPDGYNGNFFKHCWEIIKRDVLLASQKFFLGVPVPRAYGSTLLSLIPKIGNPKKFDDFRPISLSTFMSKINTKILANMLKLLLPKLISPEQVAFQPGKCWIWA
ncbi:unnamed protein product [Cuscuta campestris]|uniref:Reverse transcriptase domain-containing protein n=1 Tax=Cuscuta campestris TaxID=132261 RepID=A0A484LB96_9ASTE|nr:unnamed protein product [Cuscuta campestris]